MKIKKLAGMCNRNRNIYINRFKGFNGCTVQWVGTAHAMFKIENLPALDKESVFTIFDIPHDKESDYCITIIDGEISGQCLEDADRTEQEVAKLSTTLNGLALYKTSDGISFMEESYMAPIDDEADEIQIYSRRGTDGELYFAAKDGFSLRAIVMPCDRIEENFCTEIKNISELCQVALENKQSREIRATRKENADVYMDDYEPEGE